MVITMKPTKRVVVISGGTMYHVRPHLSLCASAYGTVAHDLLSRVRKSPYYENMTISDYYSKMAAGLEGDFETNEELADLTNRLVEDLSVKIIFFAAAVC